jgi:hypothetical protein
LRAENLKWILTYSEMRVNYHKSEIMPINMEPGEEIEGFSNVFGCPVGSFPITYLGLIDKIIKGLLDGGGNCSIMQGSLF